MIYRPIISSYFQERTTLCVKQSHGNHHHGGALVPNPRGKIYQSLWFLQGPAHTSSIFQRHGSRAGSLLPNDIAFLESIEKREEESLACIPSY